ncbi:MAG TPA: M48 family peptidase [Methanomicrobia archaeon]|nr:M48 family peptidase [Methanomicrobia archaeon]
MEIKIIRSPRRKKTIGAREVDGVIQLYLPAALSPQAEAEYVAWARKRYEARQRQRELQEANADALLEQRAQALNRQYFNGELSWTRISYTTEQNAHTFGTCDPRSGTIRISDRLVKMPRFVHDYVVVHELAHLLVPRHGLTFWQLVLRYPKTERARGYLMAVGMQDEPDSEPGNGGNF